MNGLINDIIKRHKGKVKFILRDLKKQRIHMQEDTLIQRIKTIKLLTKNK